MKALKTYTSPLFLLIAPTLCHPLASLSILEAYHDMPQAYAPTRPAGVIDQASVYVCEHVFWGGKCDWIAYNLGSGDCVPLDSAASSITPAEGYSCTFFKNSVCRDFTGTDSITLKYPGSDNLLVTDKGNFNDAIRAFQCFKAG